MTARSIGSATITFGLVSIPVSIYSTKGEERKLSFNMLHAPVACAVARGVVADGATPLSASRLTQKLACTVCEQVIDRDLPGEIVKGYEHAKGQYVTFTASELDALDIATDSTIALKEFIPVTEVDMLYLEKSYYLGADGSEQALATLYEALTTTERVGVATYAAKGRQSLVLIAPRLDASHAVLAMYELRYQHEVKSIAEVPGDGMMPVVEHVQLAVALIEQEACSTFNPGKYADDVYERQMALVKQKIANGEVIAAPPPDAAPATPTDLMAGLRASIKPIDTPVGKVRVAPRSRAERVTSAARQRTQAAKPKKAAARKPIKKAARR